MSKNKVWAIDEKGEVIAVSSLVRGIYPVEIEARTKGEATARLLSQLRTLSIGGSPLLFIQGGAYALAYASAEGGYCVQGGTLHPRGRLIDGSQFPLVSGHAESLKDVSRVASLDYYGSAEFAEEERKAYA